MKFARHSICLALVVCSSSASALAQADDANDKKTLSIDQVLEACHLIAEKHVDPPVTQQVVLFAAKAIYETAGQPIPRGLSGKVSKLRSDDEFRTLLTKVQTETNATDTTSVLTNLLSKIPGGGELIGAEEARVGEQVSANQYVGVGIALSMKDDLPFISTSFYGGPGYKVGVKTGDTILQIDGEPTKGKSLRQIVTELRGEAGSDVNLILNHPDVGRREILVTRNTTFIPTVHGASQDAEGKWNYRLASNPEIAVLKISSFGASTAHELRKLDAALSDKPPKGIILDLRGGGGKLHYVVMVADQFLEEGIIGSTIIGDREATYESEDGSLFEGIPMVILTGQSSSASSVFLAAALQDRDRAVVVGQPTNGMSYIRSQFDLGNGDKVIIPSGYTRRVNNTLLFLKPSPMPLLRRVEGLLEEETFDRKSASLVVPDHFVQATGGEGQLDPYIIRAIAVLRELKVSSR